MDHDRLIETAELVVYFGDMLMFGQHPAKGLSLHWHQRQQTWLVTLPGYAAGPTTPERLRIFADNALATLAQGHGEDESTVFIGDDVELDVMTGVDDEDGPYLIVWAWCGRPKITHCVEFALDEAGMANVQSSLRTLSRRLASPTPA